MSGERSKIDPILRTPPKEKLGGEKMLREIQGKNRRNKTQEKIDEPSEGTGRVGKRVRIAH